MKRLLSFIRAKLAHAPYKKREWYNYRAMLSNKDGKLNEKTFIECFDANGKYIQCPNVGGHVILNIKGNRFLYEIIDFKNDNPNSDWLYASDYINPIIRFVKPLKQ